jgi:hypothetical protein
MLRSVLIRRQDLNKLFCVLHIVFQTYKTLAIRIFYDTTEFVGNLLPTFRKSLLFRFPEKKTASTFETK